MGGGTGRRVVGRDVELGVLARALERAAEGEPAVLLVSGDPGMGKSTLLGEAARLADADLFVGRCVHVGGDAIPLAPVVDLIRQVRRRHDPEQLPSLDPLVELATTGASRPGDLLALALALVGELGADAPVMVAFDDLHWGDPSTWDVFEHLARNLVDERVVLVGTYRTDEVAGDAATRRRVAELSRLAGIERVVLQGLDRNAVAVQAADVLGIPAPPALVDELVRRGAGNPFFTEELAAAHLAGETIPPLLSDLLEADIAALDRPAQQVLAALAAVGRDTDPELLSRIVGFDDETTEDAVRAAIAAHLVVVDPATDSYRVRHPLIGEVAYASALPTERRRLHRGVADALRAEPRFALTPTDAAGELAFHLDRAGDEGAAFAALFDAVDSAELVAPAACLAHLDRLLELWDKHATPEHEAQLIPRLWQAADLASASGDSGRAVLLAEQAMDLGDPPEGRAWGYERLGRFHWSLGELTASAARYATAASLLDGDDDRAAATYAGLGQGSLMFRDFARAEEWTTKALAAAAPDDADARSMALRVLGVLEAMAGDFDAAIEHCERSVEEPVNPQRRALAVAYQSIALMLAGRPAEAADVAIDAAALAQRAGFETSFGAFLSGAAAHALLRLGRWDEAEVVVTDLAGIDPVPVGAAKLYPATAILAARRGDLASADAYVERLAASPVDAWHQVEVDLATAVVHLAHRRWGEAMTVTDAALDPRSGMDVRLRPELTSAFLVAAVEHALDAAARQEPVDRDAVAADLRTRLGTARDDPTAGSPLAAADLAFAEATVTRLTGPDPDAFAQAASAAESVGDRWLAASGRAQEADAAALVGDAARAVDRLRSAHAAAVELRAQPLVDEIEAIARRTRISLDAPVAPALGEGDARRLGLTSRETEVLTLVAAGHTNREIGAQLYVSEKTASVHVSNILRKLGVSSRVEAAAIAQRVGVT